MTNYSRSVLKSNGLHRSKNLPVKFVFSLKTVPANIGKKLPPQRCSKPLLIAFFNFSHKRPTFAFPGKSAYTLAFRKRIAHSGLHGETGGISGGGGITTLGAFRTFTNIPGPGIRTANFAALGTWSRVLSKNAESLRDSDALMRVAVPRRRGPAGLRNLFLLLSKLRLVHPALRTLCVYEVGVVSLPSACFACSRNAGRPLAKAANLPFSKVGWSSLTSAVQNVLDRCSLLMIDFKYQKSIINRPTKKGGPHGRLQTGRC